MERTPAYRFTVEDPNDPRIAELKQSIKINNQLQREAARMVQDVYPLFRVRLMPRGPRVEAAWGDFRSRRAYDSYLPIRHGVRYDVYVHRDTTAEWMMQREFDTGLTPGQLKRLDRELNEFRKQEWEMHRRLREKGIHRDNGEYMSKAKRIVSMLDRGIPGHIIDRIV